ncbi:hypothetical protein POM88_016363 [Heracleum sosnowskyi]|uniref:Leucine-rich repeat protein soc-2 homolog n=1 Tax=Heracleum sosnowskyi TaxID=360622 RepID=A0AAD8MSW7_9APIA|nr:hypothetical protein POM88_016363 [Heracleum sosnowskyi]
MKTIHYEVWSVRDCGKVLDLGENLIEEVPATIKRLNSLMTLHVQNNIISEEHVSWEALAEMDSLILLDMSQNLLKKLPSTTGLLKSLTYLSVGIESLMELKVNDNRIDIIPLSIDLTKSFRRIHNLMEMNLSNNHGLKCLPVTLLKECTSLSNLELQGTEITVDPLDQYEGWDNFDERRRRLH